MLAVRKAVVHLDAEVFVVDNNSEDDSVQMVREKFSEVQLIANTENAGFSIANNQAIRRSKGEYILLLNPDTVIEEDTFEKCLSFMDAHPKAGGLGVKMIDGSGVFLPESKRGFPSPFVAFCKTFGLSRLFPKSKLFNRYHLGFLDENTTHEVDVLAGAFMMLRRSVLDKIGLLDETFFMYGEDIDLSYRIVQAGYKNYYFAGSRIIHYKGESTKRGSLNYVKTFYQAMIIFARKHFTGKQAHLFVFMLRMAIYFRAFLTLLQNFMKKAFVPVLDAAVIYTGMYFLQNFWGVTYFKNPDYYEPSFMMINVPLYILVWLSGVYFSGGYHESTNLRRVVRGLFWGSLVLAAIYGLLSLEYRFSRALLIFGAVWALFSTIVLRFLIHFIKHKNFRVGRQRSKNIAIVGSEKESRRVQNLLHQARVTENVIGTVSSKQVFDKNKFLNNLTQLDEVVNIYNINEVIFCSKDIQSSDIIHWMTKLGDFIEYKIVPENSMSIIGSSSKKAAGELYTIDIRFKITYYMNRRNKRLLDFFLSLLLLVSFPLNCFFIKDKINYFYNIFKVLLGQKSWVGYENSNVNPSDLPSIKKGILHPVDRLKLKLTDVPTIQRLNFLYAKDWEVIDDLEIIYKGFRELGRK